MSGERVIRSVQLDQNTTVLVEVDPTARGIEDAAEGLPKDVIRMIQDVGAAARAAANSLQPDKLSMTFGLEAGGEAGIPFVSKGTATATFTVSVEWTKG